MYRLPRQFGSIRGTLPFMQKRYWWEHFSQVELKEWAGQIKICPHCKMLKEVIDGFGLARVRKDGVLTGIRPKGYCFKCRSQLGMVRVQRNFPERWGQRRKAIEKLKENPSYAAASRESKRLKQQREKLRFNQWKRESIRRHPERHLARMMAAIAFPDVQTCVVPACGLPAQRHHPDYTKPLQIVWLCTTHHAEVHYKGATHVDDYYKSISGSNLPNLSP